MPRTTFSNAITTTPEKPAARTLIVPVDAFPDSRTAVQRAVALGRDSNATIVLVALLPALKAEPELDRLQWEAAFMAAELGLGFSWYSEPEDEEGRQRRCYRQVLAPLGSMVEAAGLPVHLELLCEGRFAEQLRRLIDRTSGSELVLGNPLKLHKELHDLTGELLLRAPCRLHVEGLDQPDPRRSCSIWRRFVRC